MWTDTHCHLQYEGLPADALARAAAQGVDRIVCVGTDPTTSKEAIDAAAAAPGRVWATVGVHPHEAKQGTDGILALLDEPGVVAVGECGLDYHYDHSPRDVQRAVFAAQIGLARVHDKALVVHTREAWDETFEILRTEGVPDRLVFHCFTGGPEEARLALEMGAYLSFSGIVTFKNADGIRAAAAKCPANRLLVETDAPYLAPVPHRGASNEPAHAAVVGAALASLRGESEERIARVTSANATEVFRLR
ncbi:MAG TPA: TatD family hydrolase [Acidimicrobiales bacterium]|jgi:TatD DNase family protein|nr:TatD family hydrolase [Acidimicrobiales bacterium]